MIADRLERSEPYESLGAGYAAAFRFLRRGDLSTLPAGRYEVSGSDVYTLVMEYVTKEPADDRWEAHRKYADVQYVVSGSERMGVAPAASMQVSQPYVEEKDCEMYRGKGQFLAFSPGMFAIFLPQDAHMPGISDGAPAQVRKVVVKVRI